MFKNRKKIVLFMLGGGLVGLLLSFAYINFGSTCTIMCNPYLSVSIGAVFGLVLSIEEKK